MRLFFITLLLSLNSFLHADDIGQTLGQGNISILIPSSLQLIQLDDQTIDSPQLSSGTYQLNVQPGYHQLALQYLENWNDNDEAGMLVESAVAFIRFNFVADTNYRLTIPAIRDYDEAESFVANLDIRLQQNNTELSKAISRSELEQQTRKGWLMVNDQQAAPLPFESERLRNMKKLWQQATTEERKAFWIWLGP